MSTTLPIIRPAGRQDIAAISALHARAFGPGRFARSAYRVREGKGQLSRFCLVAENSTGLVGSARMTEITIGGRADAALLGPVVVDDRYRGAGLGKAMIESALAAARAAKVRLVVLVGDESYYGRFGFKAVAPDRIVLPGPVNPMRVLAAELEAGSAQAYSGMIAAIPADALDTSSSIAAQV
jgi:predicted N-acetyltransferase YhbS